MKEKLKASLLTIFKVSMGMFAVVRSSGEPPDILVNDGCICDDCKWLDSAVKLNSK